VPGENSVPHLIRTVRRPDAVWRARVVVLTTFIVAAPATSGQMRSQRVHRSPTARRRTEPS
jgi:hypothetical protein